MKEIKYILDEATFDELCNLFGKISASSVKIFETNTLYKGNGLSDDEVLRVRVEADEDGDERYILTHKSKASIAESGTKFRLEIETPTRIGILGILNSLGYKSNVTYKKERTNYHLFNHDNITVSLDKLDFGYYMEVEELNANDAIDIKTFIDAFKLQGLKVEHRTYPALMELHSQGILTSPLASSIMN